MAMQPWVCTLTPHQSRRVGKTIEELGELVAVLARLQIQDIDGIDPGSGKTNRQRMIEETADVFAQLHLNLKSFKMRERVVRARMDIKTAQMHEWEAHFAVAKKT